MKVVTKEHKTIDRTVYPCLKINPKLAMVVLFCDEKRGTCIEPGKSHSFAGDYSSHWAETDFIHFHGEVTLSND